MLVISQTPCRYLCTELIPGVDLITCSCQNLHMARESPRRVLVLHDSSQGDITLQMFLGPGSDSLSCEAQKAVKQEDTKRWMNYLSGEDSLTTPLGKAGVFLVADLGRKRSLCEYGIRMQDGDTICMFCSIRLGQLETSVSTVDVPQSYL